MVPTIVPHPEAALAIMECFWFTHDDPPLEEGECWLLLNDEEKARADRFLHPRPRREFLLTRGALKWLVAQRLGRDAQGLQFEHNATGKPHLPAGEVQFNVSHTRGFSLIGLGGLPLGVDVEPVRDLVDREGIARRWFHREEVSALQRRSWDSAAFFALWTAKEAVVKALGTGLGFGMDEVWIDLDSPMGPQLKQLGNHHEDLADWRLETRVCGERFQLALAYRGPALPVRWDALGKAKAPIK